MDLPIRPISKEDIIVWPCGTWCYREDLESFLTWKSDDYIVYPQGTDQHAQFLAETFGYA